jgi:hypothetical protein
MTASYNVPGVGVMASSALTVDAISKAFQLLVLRMLGIVTDPTADGYDALCFARVRVEFPPEGAPAWKPTEDVGFISAFEETDPYNVIREVSPDVNEGGDSYVKTTTYTRVWRVHFTLYGPNSYDHGRQIKSCMFEDFAHDTLAQSSLWAVCDWETAKRIPEKFAAQWWEVTHYEVELNEFVTETLTLPTMGSVEIIIQDADSVIIDETVEF